jgi:hypothetical protein
MAETMATPGTRVLQTGLFSPLAIPDALHRRSSVEELSHRARSSAAPKVAHVVPGVPRLMLANPHPPAQRPRARLLGFGAALLGSLAPQRCRGRARQRLAADHSSLQDGPVWRRPARRTPDLDYTASASQARQTLTVMRRLEDRTGDRGKIAQSFSADRARLR